MTDSEYNNLIRELSEFASLPPAERKIFMDLKRKKYPFFYNKNYSRCLNAEMGKINICGRGNDNIPVYLLSDLKNEVLNYANTNFNKKTVWEYSNILTKFIDFITDIPVMSITLKDIELFKSERLKSVKPATLNKDLGTLKSAFNYALKLHWIKENPFNNVKKISLPDKERLSFSDEEFNLLLSAIPEGYFKDFVLFAYYSGCRLSEIINLQINDIDFVNETITLRNKEDFKTKTGKIRQIPLTKILREIITRSINTKYKIVDINPYNKNEYIFKNVYGHKFSSDFITHKFKRYCRTVGLPEKFHFHCLRHTYITNMIKAGVNINFIKKLAGHSTIQTTMIYTHITIDDLKKALNNF